MNQNFKFFSTATRLLVYASTLYGAEQGRKEFIKERKSLLDAKAVSWLQWFSSMVPNDSEKSNSLETGINFEIFRAGAAGTLFGGSLGGMVGLNACAIGNLLTNSRATAVKSTAVLGCTVISMFAAREGAKHYLQNETNNSPKV